MGGLHLHLFDTLGQTHVHWQTNGLGTVVDENCSDGHDDLPMKCILHFFDGQIKK